MRMIFVTVILFFTSHAAIAQEPMAEQPRPELLEQYNAVWNGWVAAQTNQRYHTKKATEIASEIDKKTAEAHEPWYRWHHTFLAVGISVFAFQQFLESYIKKSSWWWNWLKPLLFLLAIISLVLPGFFDNDELIRAIEVRRSDVRAHQAMSRQWRGLSSQWRPLFETIYWKKETIHAAHIDALRQQQVALNNAEQDIPDQELLRESQKEATEYLMGSYANRRAASSSTNGPAHQ